MHNYYSPQMTAEEAHKVVFENRYMFRVHPMALLDLDEVKRRGMGTSGNASHDHAVSNQLVTRSLTVAKAAEIKAERFRIGLMKADMSVQIYEGLQAHLEHWCNYLLKGTVNNSRAPLDDLIILEYFCAAIFFEARQHFKPGPGKARMFGTKLDLSKVGVAAVRTIFQKKDNPDEPVIKGMIADAPTEEVDDGLPRRDSLMHHFSQAMMVKEGVM